MKSRIFIAVGVLFLFAAGAQGVIACSCAALLQGQTIDDFVQTSVGNSEYVFSGKVIRSRQLKNVDREVVTFSILESWKQSDEKAKRVTLQIPMNNSCYVRYRPGASYLVFAIKSWSEDLDGKREYFLSTNECLGTRPLSNADRHLAALERLTHGPQEFDGAIREIKISVKGVSLGTSREDALRQLGRPASIVLRGTNDCGGDKRTLRYPGLSVVLDEDGNQSIVVSLEIASRRWEIGPGVRIGASELEVRRVFGAPNVGSERGVLTYADGDGYVVFRFRNKRLVNVKRDLNLC
jgi:hypothetical protein